MPEPSRHYLPFPDRRSGSAFNRARRFLNNYWLVPVVVIYLQLLAALMHVHGGGESGLLARNRAFFEGVPLTFRILSYDFPYAILGHGRQLAYYLGHGAEALAPGQVADALGPQGPAVLRALLSSREQRDTEVGGIVVADGGAVRLVRVPSSNGAFLRELRRLPPEAAVAKLRDPANRAVVEALGGMRAVERIGRVVDNPALDPEARERAFSSFLYALEVASEARYVMRPLELKATLGHLESGRFLAVYHFHNELDSPPSDADIAASDDVRQLVVALARDGFDLYDLYRGRATVSHFTVTPDGTPAPGTARI